jgi:ubiquinone/menaquinone biosynthesis C-methylase UbiE
MLDDIWNSKLVEKGDNFDLIYSRFMFLHLKDVRKAVQSMKRLAKKGGVVVIEEVDHAPDSWLCYPEKQRDQNS